MTSSSSSSLLIFVINQLWWLIAKSVFQLRQAFAQMSRMAGTASAPSDGPSLMRQRSRRLRCLHFKATNGSKPMLGIYMEYIVGIYIRIVLYIIIYRLDVQWSLRDEMGCIIVGPFHKARDEMGGIFVDPWLIKLFKWNLIRSHGTRMYQVNWASDATRDSANPRWCEHSAGEGWGGGLHGCRLWHRGLWWVGDRACLTLGYTKTAFLQETWENNDESLLIYIYIYIKIS